MKSVVEKLQLKPGTGLYLPHLPAEQADLLAELEATVTVVRSLPAASSPPDAALLFVTQQQEIDALAPALAAAAPADLVLWCAYPKGSSKKYKCDFNRDTGWAALGAQGFEPVRQVAIDDDWSALRFRRVAYIRQLTRQRTISAAGEAKRVR